MSPPGVVGCPCSFWRKPAHLGRPNCGGRAPLPHGHLPNRSWRHERRKRLRYRAQGEINARRGEEYASTMGQRLTGSVEADRERERGYLREKVTIEREKERNSRSQWYPRRAHWCRPYSPEMKGSSLFPSCLQTTSLGMMACSVNLESGGYRGHLCRPSVKSSGFISSRNSSRSSSYAAAVCTLAHRSVKTAS